MRQGVQTETPALNCASASVKSSRAKAEMNLISARQAWQPAPRGLVKNARRGGPGRSAVTLRCSGHCVMKTLFILSTLITVTLCTPENALGSPPRAVSIVRVPNGGIQPQVVERDGVVHLLYFAGNAKSGDLFYVRSSDYGATFTAPMHVNHRPGSAIAVGNIRGAQLALGPTGRVHVAWNGAYQEDIPGVAEPYMRAPMLYTRLTDAGTAFEPERNVIHAARGLDGGGSLAADLDGNVYVFWHAPIPGQKGEENRRIWMAKSTDDGRSFAPEVVAYDQPTGVCGCCGMRAFAGKGGSLYVLFRSANDVVNRDMYLLSSNDRGRTFQGADISKWNVGACVMSSASLAQAPAGVLAAWETEKQVYFSRVKVGTDQITSPVPAPGPPVNRKYPSVASNTRNETLLAWTEGMGWNKGGVAAWQVYDQDGHPAPIHGKAEGVPVWSLIAAFTHPDGSFTIVY